MSVNDFSVWIVLVVIICFGVSIRWVLIRVLLVSNVFSCLMLVWMCFSSFVSMVDLLLLVLMDNL